MKIVSINHTFKIINQFFFLECLDFLLPAGLHTVHTLFTDIKQSLETETETDRQIYIQREREGEKNKDMFTTSVMTQNTFNEKSGPQSKKYLHIHVLHVFNCASQLISPVIM